MNQNTTLIRKQNRDEIALQKYTMILPLLDETMDPAALRELREKLAEQNGLSERTLRRYVNAYQKNGFEILDYKVREISTTYDMMSCGGYVSKTEYEEVMALYTGKVLYFIMKKN